jgi:hypothetical protein
LRAMRRASFARQQVGRYTPGRVSGGLGRIRFSQVGAEFSLGDENPADFCLGSIPPHVAAIGELIDMIFECIARTRWFAELGFVDGHEIRKPLAIGWRHRPRH